MFHEYIIYKELEKVPVDAEHVRSALNMSKDTTERLKKFSQVRRIPFFAGFSGVGCFESVGAAWKGGINSGNNSFYC